MTSQIKQWHREVCAVGPHPSVFISRKKVPFPSMSIFQPEYTTYLFLIPFLSISLSLSVTQTCRRAHKHTQFPFKSLPKLSWKLWGAVKVPSWWEGRTGLWVISCHISTRLMSLWTDNSPQHTETEKAKSLWTLSSNTLAHIPINASIFFFFLRHIYIFSTFINLHSQMKIACVCEYWHYWLPGLIASTNNTHSLPSKQHW